MYGQNFEVSEQMWNDKDFVLPIGKAKIEREGKDVTVVGFSRILNNILEAADILAKEGISVEVINLRTIRPLDTETIVKSVMKTNRLVTCEEGWGQSGIGAEVAAQIMESSAFDYLDAPVQRVHGVDIPMPYAFNLEKMAIPQTQNIVDAIKKVCYRKK